MPVQSMAMIKEAYCAASRGPYKSKEPGWRDKARLAGEIKRDWLEFARTLADGARAKLEEDRRRLEATRSKKSPHQLQPKGLVDPR